MASLIKEIQQDLSTPRLRAHVVRFVCLTVGSLAAQLATLGTGHLDGKVFAAMLLAAVVAAYRQWAPAPATGSAAGPPAPAADSTPPAAAAAPARPEVNR